MRSDLIEINPEVMVGKPVIRGTRITVELIARSLASGMSVQEILDRYPHLTAESIAAAQAYALAGNDLGPTHPDARTDASPLFLPWLGKPCTAIRRLEHFWSFEFDEAGMLGAESLWRIIADKRIALTLSDDGQMFGLPTPIDAVTAASQLIVGKRLISAKVDPITADLHLEFEGHVILQFLNDSSGYEGWQATLKVGGETTSIIAMGDGQIAILKKP